MKKKLTKFQQNEYEAFWDMVKRGAFWEDIIEEPEYFAPSKWKTKEIKKLVSKSNKLYKELLKLDQEAYNLCCEKLEFEGVDEE